MSLKWKTPWFLTGTGTGSWRRKDEISITEVMQKSHQHLSNYGRLNSAAWIYYHLLPDHWQQILDYWNTSKSCGRNETKMFPSWISLIATHSTPSLCSIHTEFPYSKTMFCLKKKTHSSWFWRFSYILNIF